MNIIITLPINLVAEIAEGRKQVEIRKSFPMLFNPVEDIVWVKTKGADKVALCITISHIEASSDIAFICRRYQYKNRVPFDRLMSYTKKAKRIYVWHIQRVTIFTPNLSFSDTFKRMKGPQQYYYTKVQLSDIDTNVKKQTARKIQE